MFVWCGLELFANGRHYNTACGQPKQAPATFFRGVRGVPAPPGAQAYLTRRERRERRAVLQNYAQAILTRRERRERRAMLRSCSQAVLEPAPRAETRRRAASRKTLRPSRTFRESIHRRPGGTGLCVLCALCVSNQQRRELRELRMRNHAAPTQSWALRSLREK